MIGIPMALAYHNVSQWVAHRYILHGLGKKKGSFWNFHYFEHHRASRTHDMVDEDYLRPLGWHAQGKEVAALVGATLLHLPLLPVAPFFVATYAWCNYNYFQLHRRAHLDTDWGREHLPWHYDHHMAPNQEANWCVTRPWFDELVGTREVYAGTEREEKDRARRRARRAPKEVEPEAPPSTTADEPAVAA
jgi:sterol desaturase/sphingolipid hydroxylase (fatty acid hydroxylase superfamily)